MAKEKNSKGGDKGLRNVVVAMVIFFLLVVGVSVTLSKNKTTSNVPARVSKADGWGIVFNPKAKPQIDIWEDFQCPICRQFEALNSAYINELATSGKAKIVFHPMTFIGTESVAAANAAACANDEGKFLALHTLLYQNQSATENSGKFNSGFLSQLGQTAGITSNGYTNCVTKGTYALWTKNIEGDAAGKNINATPTIFVNGKEIDRQTQYMDPIAFKKVITDAGVK